MSATPMKLEDALRLNGYTIDRAEIAATTITVPGGVVRVPAMLGSTLTWRRAGEPPEGAAFYLDRLPAFAPAYRPVLLSHVLDHYSTRRLAYDTADEFALAVRRWMNVNLGPYSTLNRRYQLAAVDLPFDTVDMAYDGTRAEQTAGTSTNADTSTTNDTATTNDTSTASDTAASTDTNTSTSKGRNASSDFPQSMIAGNVDYASSAVDQVGTVNGSGNGTTTAERELTAEQVRAAEIASESNSNGSTTGTRDETETRTEKGRSGRSVAALLGEQLELIFNADAQFVESIGSLFLSVFDRSENEQNTPGGFGYGYRARGW